MPNFFWDRFRDFLLALSFGGSNFVLHRTSFAHPSTPSGILMPYLIKININGYDCFELNIAPLNCTIEFPGQE